MKKQERREYYRDTSISLNAQEREDRRRAARRKWDTTHYDTVSCRVPKKTAQQFKELCDRCGMTRYEVLARFIKESLRRDLAQRRRAGY